MWRGGKEGLGEKVQRRFGNEWKEGWEEEVQ